MKVKIPFYCLALTMGAMTSCSNGDDNTPTPNPVEPERIEIKINANVTSRANDYGFDTGDCVGVYVVNRDGSTQKELKDAGNYVDNMRFTFSGQWYPDTPIYWTDKTTHADFYLYYPYSQVGSVSAYPFTVRADQSSEAAYKASDMLVGRALDVAPTEDATIIPADHVMSLIVIKLEAGNGFTAESLANANPLVKVNGVKTRSTVDLSTGKVTPAGDATSVIPFKTSETYKAIIVPQTVEETNLISVVADGREFNLRKAFTFEAGKSHRFTVTLSKTSNGVNVNITQWEDDGTDNGGVAE